MQHDQSNPTVLHTSLADAVRAWNDDPACKARMEWAYEGPTRVGDANGVQSVRGELIAMGAAEEDNLLDELWVLLQTCPQAPRIVTRDHRPANALAGTCSVDIFIWQDTLENNEKVHALETMLVDTLTHLQQHHP